MSEITSGALAESIVAGTREEHTALAAELLARAIQAAVDERGVARVALSGGSTPGDTYRRIATEYPDSPYALEAQRKIGAAGAGSGLGGLNLGGS